MKANLVLQILNSIPQRLEEHTMIFYNEIGSFNSQEYTCKNCESRNSPYLENFVDIDSYINERGLRMQGYLPITKISDLDLSIEQLQFILKLISSNSKWVKGRDNDSFNLEVWSYTISN